MQGGLGGGAVTPHGVGIGAAGSTVAGSGGLFSPATPRSRSRRRKRLRETMQQLASDDSPCAPQLTLPARLVGIRA